MAELPPNQFVFGALDLPPDRTAAPASQPESPAGAAADLSVSPGPRGDVTAARNDVLQTVGATVSARGDDLSDIGEIFIGAARLEPPEIWFENSAYPPQDELLFDVLSAMVDPNAPCLREIPDEASFMIELGPPPLFLRKAG